MEPRLVQRAFCMNDQWVWLWSADWADVLIKQVAWKMCRIIPSCRWTVTAVLLNPPAYWFITVLGPGNTCCTKKAACICLCKSWHSGKIKCLWKHKNHPKLSIWNAEKFLGTIWKDCRLPYRNLGTEIEGIWPVQGLKKQNFRWLEVGSRARKKPEPWDQ